MATGVHKHERLEPAQFVEKLQAQDEATRLNAAHELARAGIARRMGILPRGTMSKAASADLPGALLAVLHRHAGIVCFDQDVFVNAVGGVKITEPGADLAVLLAIVSSLKNKPLPEKTVVFGEVGLAGEVRPVQRGQERLKEAAKLGFVQAIVPKANKPKQAISGIEIIAVERVDEEVAKLR